MRLEDLPGNMGTDGTSTIFQSLRLENVKRPVCPQGFPSNVWTAGKRIEKLRYMHRNPVVRGLVEEPEQWPWSSYRSYALGEEGAVRINQWGEAKIKTLTQAAAFPPLQRT
jgi:hypothetical protein